ncbi:hypothetical protein ABPG72_017163 [Tetrahymena utriculariae]
MKKQFREYLSTILEIMEDKPSFLIPKIIYYAIIIIYFNQIAGYLFSTQEKKVLKEQKAKFIGRVNELSTGTYLLFYKGEDNLTLLIFGIFQFSMYFYYIYVGIYSYLRRKKQIWLSKNKQIFKIVNQYLNIFFTLYWWVFFTPFVEINATMLSCNNYAFLKIMRNQDCSNVNPAIFVLGYIGFFFSVTTAVISIFLFRNNEFGSKDYLRRKFNFIQIIILICRATVIFLYFLNLKKMILFKELLMCFLIFLIIIDIYVYRPYYNQDIIKMYSCCVAAFSVGIITIIIFNETDQIHDTDVFYYFVLYTVIFSSAFIIFLNYSYENIIRLNLLNFKEHCKKIDFYLEEIFNILENNKKSEEAQFRLFEVLIYHKQFCQNYNCQCQSTSFKNSENNIIKEDVLKFIETIFQFSLKQKQVKENQDLFEHLSLKYISFIAKYRNNPVKAYYELKQLMSQHTNKISFYFDCIQNIFSSRIEEMILLHQQNKLKEKKDQNQVYSTRIDEDISKLELSDFIQSDKIKTKILPLFSQFVDQKVNLYERMRAGFKKISLFGDKITSMSKIASKVTVKLKTYLGRNISFSFQANQSKRTSQNVYILKILSMYEGIVLNRMQESIKYEDLILELKKRDYLLNQAVLNTLNILKGNVLTVIVSQSKECGKIISLNSKRINSFFGYSQNSDLNFQYIDQFMPQFLQKIHNSLMQNYIRRSYSPLINQNHFSYALNSEGLIFPISISLENIFEYKDDFCLYGSILKLENAKELFVINIKGQILGLTQLLYEDVFKTAEQSQNFKSKKVHLDVFDITQKLSIYMILPELLDVILKHQQQQSEEEGLDRFDLDSTLETIAQNQQGVIKIPESIFELQKQFKANQYFISEKSKGLSQTSLQTSIFQHQDSIEIIEQYQNFYKENLVEWSKQNLASETKIKYNLIKQSLKHMQDKKKITEEYYIIQINESSRITSEIDRKDSLEINSPKKYKKRKGDALSTDKSFTNKRISFYDVFKLATQKQSNQHLQNNQINTPSNSTQQGTPYMRKRNLLVVEQDNYPFNQSSTSLDKHLAQNFNLNPEISNKIGERKSRYLSSFTHLSDKNHGISQQNIYNVEKSLINLNNETQMTSNQNSEIPLKLENNSKLQISRINNHNSNHSYDVLSPSKGLLGPQFSKDNKPIMKTASKDFEPKFSIDENEKPDEEKIKIKNLFLHQSSIDSSSVTARTPSLKPKLSLWQRIKNKVSTANTQTGLQRGIVLFLKERQEAFNEEKQDNIFQNPETISSNIAMDMDYEDDVDDVEISSITKKGTTTVRKNGKSTQGQKTNFQIRSFSHISSQNSQSYGTYLFQSIAYSFHMPSIFYKLKIFFVFFVIIFISLQVVLSLGIITQYSKLKDDLSFNQIALVDDSSIQIQLLNSINLFAIQIGLISGQYQTSVQNQITNISTNYGQIFPKILQQYLDFQQSQSSLYDVDIFSFKYNSFFMNQEKNNFYFYQLSNQQVERKSLAELKYYNLNSITQVLQLGKNSNKLLTDQFFYLSKNSLLNQNLDKSLLSNSFSNFRDLQNTLDWRVNFFIGSYIIVFFFFIICFLPFLRQINSYQERVLILIARMTESECLQESTKLSEVLRYIQSKNEQWIYKNFMISDQQSLNEAVKKSIKSTLPSLNSMLIDWSLLINFGQFQLQNQHFPNLDISQLNQDYQLSFKNVSNFLNSFQQEINQLSSISNSNSEDMNQIYTQSLCQYFQQQQLCNQVSEYTQQIYEKGLASLISNYLLFLNNYGFLLGNISPTQQQNAITQYYSTVFFTELILINYSNTAKFIQEIINIRIIFPLISNKCLLPIDKIIVFFLRMIHIYSQSDFQKQLSALKITDECKLKQQGAINVAGFKSFIILMVVCGAIHMNKILIEEFQFRFKQYYDKLSTFCLWFALILSSLNICNYIYEFYAFILYYIGLFVLIIFGLVFRSKLGFSEAIFNLVVVPLVVLMSSLIITMEFNIDIVVKFSPLNLLFIVYSITQTSSIQFQKPKQSNEILKKQSNDIQTFKSNNGDNKQKKSPTRVTIFELLGKHDCFRVMVLIMAYIYLYSIVEATKAKSIVLGQKQGQKLMELEFEVDRSIPFIVEGQSLLKEFECTVCQLYIKQAHITKCGHVFCKECILESINRHHRCPFCSTDLKENDVIKNYHLDNLKNVILKAQEEYKNSIINQAFNKREQGNEESQILNIFRDNLRETILLYESKFKEINLIFKEKKKIIEKQLEIQSQLQNQLSDQIRAQSCQLENQKIIKLEQEKNEIQKHLIENLNKYLKTSLPKPDILDLRVKLIIPKKNLYLESFILKPYDQVSDFKQKLIQIFQKNNNPIDEQKLDLNQIFVISLPLKADNEEQINKISKESFFTEQNLIQFIQQNGIEAQVRSLTSKQAFVQLQIQQGSTLIIQGTIPSNSDKPPTCLTYKFQQNTTVDYYTCVQCNLNWICQSCAFFCHKEHNTVIQIKNHLASWACCYCVTKNKCKALNKNSK